MQALLASTVFRYLLFPLGSILLGIWIKYVTRNDQYAKFQKEDIAVGLDLIRTALLMYAVLLSDRALALSGLTASLKDAVNKTPPDLVTAMSLQTKIQGLSSRLVDGAWLLLAFFIALWATSTVVRRWGWKSETELHLRNGIVIPLLMGVISLIVVLAGAGTQ